ncbi:MAG TPA: glycosyltransferase 87 family protein [Candidatus Acidoferrum sp.]|nr:glycosyltransferase 87 family protein [Candidatus Acidoferrum sp.]
MLVTEAPATAPATTVSGWLDRHGTRFGLLVAVGLWAVMVVTSGVHFDITVPPLGNVPVGPALDARAYWEADFAHPYANASAGVPGAYLYSPAFLLLLTPLRLLPWPLFVAVWVAVLLVAVRWLVGPRLLGLAVIVAFPELWGANIVVLLAAALVAGFMLPGTWAFHALTKVTPAVGVLWFAVRREWRALGEVAIVTAAFVAASYVLMPGAWADWIAVLRGNTTAPGTWASLNIPLVVRAPFAVALVAWAAWTGRRWVLPIGCLLALPILWYGGFALLLAVVPVRWPGLTGRPARVEGAGA